MPEIDSEIEQQSAPTPEPRKSAAGTVAGGIFASRILGFVREIAVGFFFGVGPHADVFRVAFRGPNVLQNLLGEGTISAAFIPVYCRLMDEEDEKDAGRFAGAIFGLLLAVVSVIVVVGILLAPYFVALLSPGFVGDAGGDVPPLVAWATGQLQALAVWLGEWFPALLDGDQGATTATQVDRYALTVQGVRIILPMTGILVLSAWALGVLNSHRRFFLPYIAPVLWNVAIIGALFIAAVFVMPEAVPLNDISEADLSTLDRLLTAAFIGALVGGALQFLVQLPLVFKLMKGFRLSFSTHVRGVRESIRAFGPVVAGRGAYQLSTWIDLVLASLITAGALGALGFAQTLYVLPVSLFGMSVAASELPELSSISKAESAAFVRRLRLSLRQIMFLTVPTFVGYLVLGLPLVRGLFERGNFGYNDSWLIYLVLGGYTLGLLATTASRLLQNAFYALGDTKTPARFAVIRVAVSAIVALPLMFFLDRFSVARIAGTSPQENPLFIGAVGLAVAASVGAWVELWKLRGVLRKRIGFELPWSILFKMLGVALIAVIPGALVWWLVPAMHPVLNALLTIGTFGLTYLALAHAMGLEEMSTWIGRFKK